ncbi:MAG: response regulator [Planctomycetes bacterium]|nr:response regulator [Planctomycetota bacterium]MBI3845183.1 response regulator [Planctomycetota bacterium]
MNDKSRVLIVDDEPSERDTLRALLEKEGYDLVFADSGREALKVATQQRPDLILLDVMMPDMDGFEACRRLRAHPWLAEVPIILVTALDDRHSRVAGIESGADDFVSKPIDRLELRARVRTVTRLNRFRRLVLERAKFQWVVENADDGYVILDRYHLVLYANPCARRLLGLSLDDPGPIGEPFLAVARKHYRTEPAESWVGWPDHVPTARRRLRYLVRAESSRAEACWLQAELLRVDTLSSESFLVRLRNASAEVQSRFDQWTFHRFVRHKLVTPIGPLNGSLEMLQAAGPSLPMSERKELLGMAATSAKRLSGEIEAILGYMQVGHAVHSEKGRCSGRDLRSVVEEARDRLALRSVRVACEIGVDDVALPLSRHAIELVCLELLENSKKFHPSGSPNVEVAIDRIPEGIRIRVSDDGINVPPEHLDTVWIPYYQAEKLFTGQVPGMGLGLSTIATLVWGVGGTARMQNREDGAGVIVELVLPPVEPNPVVPSREVPVA